MGFGPGTDPSATHQWLVAATVAIPHGLARRAESRGTYKLPEQTKVSVQEIYCGACRRPYEDVADKPCEALDSRDHLIGGPTGERKKRVSV